MTKCVQHSALRVVRGIGSSFFLLSKINNSLLPYITCAIIFITLIMRHHSQRGLLHVLDGN